MKRFFIGVLTGLVFAVAGTFVLFLLAETIDLSCRDCQGAAGMLIMIFFAAIAVLFVIGFLIGFFFRRRKTNEQSK